MATVASAGIIAAPYSTLVRAPAFDSAVIKSDRLGGNFAYSTIESHAYAHHTPIIQHVATPVAVSYSVPAPAYYPGYLAHPGFFAPQLIAAAAPVADAAAPVAPALVEAPVEAVKAEEPVVEEAVATEAPAAPAVEEPAAPVESTAAPTDAAAAAASDDTVAVEAA